MNKEERIKQTKRRIAPEEPRFPGLRYVIVTPQGQFTERDKGASKGIANRYDGTVFTMISIAEVLHLIAKHGAGAEEILKQKEAE